MRLLIVTQAVDRNDPVLGFFHGWLLEFAQRFDSIVVICLRQGDHELPSNVKVYSLGKENGRPFAAPVVYSIRFLKLVWSIRSQYDAVLVHMNQEYLLLAGWFWRIWGKPAYLWRNHYHGSFMTDIAASFCAKIFCTSRYSYTAKYKKTFFMPVGVNTDAFRPIENVQRRPKSILFLARFAPSKRPHVFVEALGILHANGAIFSASVYGSPLERDKSYLEEVKARCLALGLKDVEFYPGPKHADTPAIYNGHELFVDLGSSGMYNKTIFEAAACGCLVLATSSDYASAVGTEVQVPEDDAIELSKILQKYLAYDVDESRSIRDRCRKVVQSNSLHELARKLYAEVSV